MAKYEITSPDGQRYEITAPDNANEAQVLQYAQQQFSAPQVARNGPMSLPEPEDGRSLNDFVADLNAQRPTSQVHGFIEGLTRPVANIDRGVGAVLNKVGIDTGYKERYENYKGRTQAQPGVASGFPQSGTIGKIAGSIAGTLPASVYLGPLAGGATAGALLSESDTAGGVALDTAIGGALGYGADKLLKGVSKAVRPATISNDAAALQAEGVPLTVGQAIGGAAKRIEDKAASVPVFGDAIVKAQGRATEGFNRAAFNRALAPIGQKLPMNKQVGREAVDYVAETLGKEYDNVLSQMTGTADSQFVQDMTGIIAKAQSSLPEPQYKQFQRIVETQISGKAKGNAFSSDVLKGVESELSRLAKGYAGDASFDNRMLGETIDEVQTVFRDMVARSNPQQAMALAKVNEGYANFVRLRQAAASVGAEDGVFTAPQLQNAVKGLDKSVGKGQFARGKALMQDLSEAGKNVLPSKVPNSGTADRLLLAAGPAAFLDPSIAMAAISGPALYSPMGQKLALGALTGAPQARNAIGNAALQLRRPASALAPVFGNMLFQGPNTR